MIGGRHWGCSELGNVMRSLWSSTWEDHSAHKSYTGDIEQLKKSLGLHICLEKRASVCIWPVHASWCLVACLVVLIEHDFVDGLQRLVPKETKL